MLTSRERVIAAIEHREPDRVPVDLGSNITSGISARTLVELRKHLGLPDRLTKVYEIIQMLGLVEEDVVDALCVDILPVHQLKALSGIEYGNYKPWKLFDGTEVLVPGQFDVEIDTDGSLLLHDGCDPSAPVIFKMPRDGYYFDGVGDQSLSMEYTPPPLEDMEEQYAQPVPARELEFLAEQAVQLRKTDKALFLEIWPYVGAPGAGNMCDWLCLMASDPEYVSRLFEMKAAADIEKLQSLWRYIGDNADIFGIDAFDYGTQRAEMFSPELFERYYLPYYKTINSWVHSNTPWKTWKHCCGSICNILPMFVESGLDCINPVQCSADGMEPTRLKEKFGDKITFWGGAINTQQTLPFGTPDEVYHEALERIRILGQGGGFVFNAIHNIQAKTPPENIVAMYQAVKDCGKYPLACA